MCFVFRSEENRRYFTAGTGMLGDALESGQKSLGFKDGYVPLCVTP
jgi:hypothetical protein